MMSLKEVVKQRYLAETFGDIARRVSATISRTSKDRLDYLDLMEKKMFIPAGNTLLAGVQPVRPNCCILPTVTDDNLTEIVKRSVLLWQDRIGIGFDLNGVEDPVSALEILSKENADIDLGHRAQRGNMAVLDADHPKIEEFIRCKDQNSKFYNFNISVGMVSKDLPMYATILNIMAERAWKCGDPGIVFTDRIGKVPDIMGNPESVSLPHLGKCSTLVPCGEQSMFPNEVCTLGSMNLASPEFWNGRHFDVGTFMGAVSTSVKFLDDTVDNMELSDIHLKMRSSETRRIGLGVMGLADTLKKMQLEYASPEALKFADTIGSAFQYAAHRSSQNLSKERGQCPALVDVDVKRRNITVTCIAPTGGITLLTDNLGFGIEPLFQEAHSIKPQDHLRVQSRWQNYVDNCISKTINLSEDATVDDIKDVWIQASKLNIKSVTVYRNNSKSGQPVNTTPVCKAGTCNL